MSWILRISRKVVEIIRGCQVTKGLKQLELFVNEDFDIYLSVAFSL